MPYLSGSLLDPLLCDAIIYRSLLNIIRLRHVLTNIIHRFMHNNNENLISVNIICYRESKSNHPLSRRRDVGTFLLFLLPRFKYLNKKWYDVIRKTLIQRKDVIRFKFSRCLWNLISWHFFFFYGISFRY